MSDPLKFERAGDDDRINLAVGQPSTDLIPKAMLQTAAARAFNNAPEHAFNYGDPQGELAFRAALALFLQGQGQAKARAESLFLTGGSSQALDFVCERFTQPGDVVLVEDSTYFLALQIFKDRGLDIVGLPCDAAGIQLPALINAIKTHKPRLLYTIASFANPTGLCLAEARRAEIARLSRQHNFIVAADEAYQLLHFEKPAPKSFSHFLNDGNILCLGTFSKILAPGLRVGWLEVSDGLMPRLLASGWVNSGGAINQMASFIVTDCLQQGAQALHLSTLRRTLAARAAAMQSALEANLSELGTWTAPAGGYFFWVRLADPINTDDLVSPASRAGVGFQPGNFSSANGRHPNYLRLSFAAYGIADIETGIRRLRAVLIAR
ncbi:MAG: PLP-dependent aminotransferase family protein [Pseudomonadales bacterium]|jgi:2-aminoadipate transaminase